MGRLPLDALCLCFSGTFRIVCTRWKRPVRHERVERRLLVQDGQRPLIWFRDHANGSLDLPVRYFDNDLWTAPSALFGPKLVEQHDAIVYGDDDRAWVPVQRRACAAHLQVFQDP